MISSRTWLGVVNSYDSSHNYYTKSVVYQASGGHFIKYQEGSSYLSFDLMSYEYKGDTYLAVANHNNHKYNINSALYKWA